MLPYKRLNLKGRTCYRGKMSLSLVAAHMNVSCKLQPFVIGKSRVPPCVKSTEFLPAQCTSQKKAWMTLSFHWVMPGMRWWTGQPAWPGLSFGRQRLSVNRILGYREWPKQIRPHPPLGRIFTLPFEINKTTARHTCALRKAPPAAGRRYVNNSCICEWRLFL